MSESFDFGNIILTLFNMFRYLIFAFLQFFDTFTYIGSKQFILTIYFRNLTL